MLKSIKFKECNSIVLTKRQGQHVMRDLNSGKLVYCFKLGWKEVLQVLVGRKLWVSQNVHKSDKKVQQIFISTKKEDVIEYK